MPRTLRGRVRIPSVLEGRRRAREAASRLGQSVRAARTRRRWTQRQLAERLGVSRSRVAQLEGGTGGAVPSATWFTLSVVLDIPLRVEFGRDALTEPIDAGHLKMQELMLRLGRQLGIARTFELPTRPQDPALSVDVCWRDDTRRVLILNECWNTFGSVNAAVRSTHRKMAEAEQLAAPMGPNYRVATCWIVRDTRRNRELMGRYPEVFANAFPASSSAWVRALTTPAAQVPTSPGLVWADLQATRLFARRQATADSAA
jgi:transcriptional regulator with XRE-family HTH domain